MQVIFSDIMARGLMSFRIVLELFNPVESFLAIVGRSPIVFAPRSRLTPQVNLRFTQVRGLPRRELQCSHVAQ